MVSDRANLGGGVDVNGDLRRSCTSVSFVCF